MHLLSYRRQQQSGISLADGDTRAIKLQTSLLLLLSVLLDKWKPAFTAGAVKEVAFVETPVVCIPADFAVETNMFTFELKFL